MKVTNVLVYDMITCLRDDELNDCTQSPWMRSPAHCQLNAPPNPHFHSVSLNHISRISAIFILPYTISAELNNLRHKL